MNWDLPIGTEFAGYRIMSILGRGGMSIVYTAEQVRLRRSVALKLLSPALAADEGFRERFIRESHLAAALNHPNIIPIHDAGEADGFFYIAMGHVDGADLGSLLNMDGPLPLDRIVGYLDQIAAALDDANEQGLVHRDVKPANILIERRSDRAYLSDFGVAKQVSSPGLTKTGYFLGTFEYAAPEQLEGKPVDGRTDQYALGCVLYECVSGKPPFIAETPAELIHAHRFEPPPQLTKARPDLPPEIDRVIATAMAKKKEDRYASCSELVNALKAIAGRAAASPRRAAAAPRTVQTPASRIVRSNLFRKRKAVEAGRTLLDRGLDARSAESRDQPPMGWLWGRPRARLVLIGTAVPLAAAVIAAVLLISGGSGTDLLSGGYVTKITGATPARLNGTWRLTLKSKRYSLTRNGAMAVAGLERISGKRVTFHDLTGPYRCTGTQAIGTYRWSLSGTSLTLTVAQDDCSSREAILTNGLTKLPSH